MAAEGFTLVETVVGLTVSAAVLVAAHSLFQVVGDVGRAVPLLAAAGDREWNSRAELRELLGQVEVATDSTRRFSGAPLAADFVSWCRSGGGWRERCRVRLNLTALDGDSAALVGEWLGRRAVLLRGARPARLLYLVEATDGGLWSSRWGVSLSAPLALLVILGSDTLLLRIGERG